MPAASVLDADGFEAACVDAFVASWSARGFSPVFIENATGVLERFLTLLGVPAWEAVEPHTPHEVRETVNDQLRDNSNAEASSCGIT